MPSTLNSGESSTHTLSINVDTVQSYNLNLGINSSDNSISYNLPIVAKAYKRFSGITPTLAQLGTSTNVNGKNIRTVLTNKGGLCVIKNIATTKGFSVVSIAGMSDSNNDNIPDTTTSLNNSGGYRLANGQSIAITIGGDGTANSGSVTFLCNEEQGNIPFTY